MEVSGTGKNKVMLVGEALGEVEARKGLPFQGPAGDTLNRILQRGGLNRDDFTIANAIWCRPPDNKLSGEEYEAAALASCRPYLDRALADAQPRVVVGLGAVATRALLPNLQVGVLQARGYVFPFGDIWMIPTVHPSFIMRGKTAWAQVLLYDIQHAVDIARVP